MTGKPVTPSYIPKVMSEMMLNGRQSTNIEDVRQSTSSQAAHADPYGNRAVNQSKQEQYQKAQADGLKLAKKTASDPKNPFSKMVQGVSTAARKIKRAKPNPMAKIPIPTPRPDPMDSLPPVFQYPGTED